MLISPLDIKALPLPSFNAPDVLTDLQEADFQVIHVIKDPVCHKKASDPEYNNNLRQLHLEIQLELNILQSHGVKTTLKKSPTRESSWIQEESEKSQAGIFIQVG